MINKILHISMKVLFKFGDLLSNFFALPDKIRYFEYRKKYHIHESFNFNNLGTLFYGEGEIRCGEGSYIGRYGQVFACKGCKVIIGKHCEISHFVKIYTSNNEADQDMSQKFRKEKTGDVIIGDYCWIGAGVFINAGCKIGDNSVIGANSVVTKDIPAHCIAAGAPAKILKFKSYFDKQNKTDLAG
jgi:maltose O-acetyltransferase